MRKSKKEKGDKGSKDERDRQRFDERRERERDFKLLIMIKLSLRQPRSQQSDRAID